MPRMTGVELMQRILARDKRQAVILNTSYQSYQNDFSVWSADAYVVKSRDTGELKQAIRSALAKRVNGGRECQAEQEGTA